MNKLFRLISLPIKLLSLCFLNKQESRVEQLLKLHRTTESIEKQPILVQIVEDYAFLNRFIFFLKASTLSTKQKYDLNWVYALIPFRNNCTFKNYWLGERIYGTLARGKWIRLFLALGGKVVGSNNGPKPSHNQKAVAKELLKKISSTFELVEINYAGILIGDLVNDTYLRFAHQPTVHLDDPFLLEVMEWAISLTDKYDTLFRTKKFLFYLCSYTTYIQHGTAARMALKHNVPVYSMGTYNQLVVRPQIEFAFHKRDFHKYRIWFDSLTLTQKEEGLRYGHESLNDRLSGKLDKALWYMRQSAYLSDPNTELDKILSPKIKKTVLVVTHDFFDSPHIYGKMIFPDFYIWLEKTLETLYNSEYEVLIKPHPNSIKGNAETLDFFAKKYPSFIFLPQKTSSAELVKRGVDLVVTIYGTIGHEMAYLGVPVLCAGVNPHLSFNFCTTAKSKDEYYRFLRNIDTVPIPPKQSSEVAAFYYVHNYRNITEKISLFPFQLSCEELSRMIDPDNTEFASRIETIQQSLERVSEM